MLPLATTIRLRRDPAASTALLPYSNSLISYCCSRNRAIAPELPCRLRCPKFQPANNKLYPLSPCVDFQPSCSTAAARPFLSPPKSGHRFTADVLKNTTGDQQNLSFGPLRRLLAVSHHRMPSHNFSTPLANLLTSSVLEVFGELTR
jgi:hypothetical protein